MHNNTDHCEQCTSVMAKAPQHHNARLGMGYLGQDHLAAFISHPNPPTLNYSQWDQGAGAACPDY